MMDRQACEGTVSSTRSGDVHSVGQRVAVRHALGVARPGVVLDVLQGGPQVVVDVQWRVGTEVCATCDAGENMSVR